MTEAVASHDTLDEWLTSHRISTTSLLSALNDLGATDPADLLDLTEDDLLQFQPPFLKKLEYVRLTRGISLLQQHQKQQQQIPPSSLTATSSSFATISMTPSVVKSSSNVFVVGAAGGVQRDRGTVLETCKSVPPPLPSQCPTAGCKGELSVHLGNRKSKYLMNIRDTSDSRWTATCSSCSKKWHCCHYNCGKLQKISSLGTSDIIRHEQGRFNRFQRKIQLPCSMNPQMNVLKAGYDEELKEMNRLPSVVHINASEGGSSLTETRDASAESWSFPLPVDALESNFLEDVLDNDIKSGLDSFDSDDAIELNHMATTFDPEYILDVLEINDSDRKEEPLNKRAKSAMNTASSKPLTNDNCWVNELCCFMKQNCVITKAVIKMKKNCTYSI